MARQARNYDDTQIYHTIVRGNSSEEIFADDCDKQKIVRILYEKSSDGAFDIIAYCILSDHAHFLIKEQNLCIAEAMKRINTSYAAYYNRKNNRYGHVFYSRYLSEGISGDEKLMHVIKYIINHAENENEEEENCSDALSVKAQDIFYEYYDYIRKCLISDGQDLSFEYFLQYLRNDSGYDYIMDLNNSKEDIVQAKNLLCDYFNLGDVMPLDLKRRDCLQIRTQMILYLKENTNLSIRKIAEVLNLNRGIVYKIICENKD